MAVDWHILIVVAIAILMDITTGIVQALANKTLSSEKMRAGIYHKASYAFCIATAVFLEYGMTIIDLGYPNVLLMPVCAYVILTEVISVTENILKLNPELKDSKIFELLSNNQSRRESDMKED